MNFLPIRDPAVQQFLWEHLTPTDIRHDFTKADAIKFVYDEIVAGRQWLVGDMDAGLAFRAHLRNPLVMEVHIMGSPARLRSLLQGALDLAWRKAWNGVNGIERIVIVTVYDSLAAILKPFGFVYEGSHPRAHWNGSELVALHVLTLEKPETSHAA